MSTHNICFRGEIRKILCGYPLLSVALCTSSRTGTCLWATPSEKCLRVCVKCSDLDSSCASAKYHLAEDLLRRSIW